MAKIVQESKHGARPTGDRRVQRTQQLLGDALVALISEQKYDTITVQDILDRANVGRSTFYTYYYDKDDLLVSRFRDVLDHLSAQLDAADSATLVPSLELFRHIRQYQAHYHFVTGHAIHLLHHETMDYVRQHVEQRLAEQVNPKAAGKIPLALVSSFIAATLFDLCIWWLEHGAAYSPEQMDEMFCQLVMPGIEVWRNAASA